MLKKVSSFIVFLCTTVMLALTVFPVVAPGDANSDSKVDVIDLCIVARAYATCPGNPDWDPRADLNPDNLIDILDLQIVIDNFGTNVDSLSPQISSGTVWVKLLPTPQFDVPENQFFDVQVGIFDVSGLYQYQFMISWDPSTLPIEYVSVTEGSFLQSPGGLTVFVYKDDYLTMDRLLVGCTLVGRVPPVSGSGILATIRFKCTDTTTGREPIDFISQLFDVNMNPIPHKDKETKVKQTP